MQTSIYLAGPDVFLPDALAVGAAKQAICAGYGIEGLFPLSEDEPGDAYAIYRECQHMMRQADIGVFNLTPFRGPSADPGTVLELGYMAALGKPVFGYSATTAPLKARLGALDERDGKLWGQDGCFVEDFGLADNLMLEGVIADSGGCFIAIDEAGIAAMAAFDALIEEVAQRAGSL